MGTVTYLIGRVKKGSYSAFDGLVGRMFPDLARQACRRLRNNHTGVQDAEDIANATFWELWQVISEERPLAADLSNTASLLKILATLTRQQVGRAHRDATRQCRDARRTRRSLDLPAEQGGTSLHEPGTNPWPSFLGALDSKETVETLIALLPREKQKTLIRLRLQGRSQADIADQWNCSVRSVVRLYAEIVDLWRSHPAGRRIVEEW
jgi:RNA polymerase sigma factor (sigma-70 family)